MSTNKTAAFNLDCMVGMKQYDDKYFDLAIVDPPYGINCMKMSYATYKDVNVKHGKHAAAYNRAYLKPENWDTRPDKTFFDELKRVSKKQIVFGGNYFTDFLEPSPSFLVWDKRVFDNARNDFADCEYAWMPPSMGVARVFRFMWMGMLQGNMKKKEARFHPTQKPVELYAWILNNYANQNDKILDTHLGSGSSRIAAYDLGFEFVGYEIDKQYFDIQEKRFMDHIMQTSLFDQI